MMLSTITETNWSAPPLAAIPFRDQTERLMAALGVMTGDLPTVDERSLARYYTYLSANLTWPFTAYYPQPTSAQEETEFDGTILELLDPTKDIYDEFDGIFCKIRKGGFEVNLPLIELHVSQDSPNFQLIEDYWYWFWNWR